MIDLFPRKNVGRNQRVHTTGNPTLKWTLFVPTFHLLLQCFHFRAQFLSDIFVLRKYYSLRARPVLSSILKICSGGEVIRYIRGGVKRFRGRRVTDMTSWIEVGEDKIYTSLQKGHSFLAKSFSAFRISIYTPTG